MMRGAITITGCVIEPTYEDYPSIEPEASYTQ